MGLFVEDEIELPETGLVVSNVYISFSTRTFGIMQYRRFLQKIVDAPTGYDPACYAISVAVEFYNKDKTVNYEHSSVNFFVTKKEISTIPFYNLVYRELKKMFPTARDSI